MENEVKIIELELGGMTLKPSDLRMGGVIETSDGTRYIVIIIGARFEFNDEDEPVLLPEQHNAVVGEDLGDAPEDDPGYSVFYNLKLADMNEEDMNSGPTLFSEKGEGKSYETPKGATAFDNIPTMPGRTPLQDLLFSIHAHHDPEGAGHIIYFEKDLVKVCDYMLKELRKSKELAGSDEFTSAALGGQMDIIKQMKDFFEHKV